MFNYQGILQFKGKWRDYQARVLQNAGKYLSDGRIHIVAAPGSGKTTLGIELIRRLNEKALVLTPSITIREQWVARIAEAFLCEGMDPDDYLSQSLKEPKAITVATYQSLHSAMTRGKDTGEVSADSEADTDDTNNAMSDSANGTSGTDKIEDYKGFDLVATMKAAGIGVLCLDECHHLRSEWWKALEDFKNQLGNLRIIALTATPPYDSTPALWNRYMNMCGEIDEEITIPELVKEGSLCPHQDYVYFNYPTKEEEQEVKSFEERSRAMVAELKQDTQLWQTMLGNPIAPAMTVDAMEQLLQEFLYDDTDAYPCEKEYRESVIDRLKSQGLIDKKKVMLAANPAVEKMLTTSLGKCNSIRDIVFHEYAATGKELRLLVLTDYIRKEHEKNIGDPQKDVTALGVLPFFEMLRRENEAQKKDIRLGVLCGTIVIIPAEAREALEQEIADTGKVNFAPVGNLGDKDYIKVTAVGDAHFLTGAVTNIFTKGYMQVLIGTKSLLGEGWDSPCINSLILASFVGSFMLSNQMRGRAIRVFKDVPDKTSNIWHLVCLRPWNEAQTDNEVSEDFSLLSRRMEHFLGLHYTEDVIESGISRLSIIQPPFDEEHVRSMNQQMLALSGQRQTLKDRWQRALTITKKMQIADETQVDASVVPTTVYDQEKKEEKKAAAVTLAAAVATGLVWSLPAVFPLVFGVGALAFLGKALTKRRKAKAMGTAVKRLNAFGDGIAKAMKELHLFEDGRASVAAEENGPDEQTVYLVGGSSRDRALFAQCVSEFFGPINQQRYLLVKPKKHDGADGIYAVPEIFSKKKEDAQLFASCMEPYMGNYELMYTKNDPGKKVLMEGRMKSLSSQKNSCICKKKVKNALK